MEIEFKSTRLQVDEWGKTNLSEKDIVETGHPTSASWEEVFECVLLPEEVQDLRILDVGAGASDAVSKLLELGADAYAIDPRYKSKSTLRGQVKSYNQSMDMESKNRRNQSLERFSDSIKDNPERYIEASTTCIPFPDDFFDIVYSRIAVTYYLDIDRAIFSRAVNECIRVTKPGGTVRLFPYMDEEPAWPVEVNDLRLRNEREVVDQLKKDPKVKDVTEVEVNINNLVWRLLIIEKA